MSRSRTFLSSTNHEQVCFFQAVMPLTHGINNLIIIVHLRAAFDQGFDGAVRALDSFGYLIDVLRLDDSFQVVLQHFCEIVWPNTLELEHPMGHPWAYFVVQTRGSISKSLPSPAGCHNDPS